jgi:serine/threonine-protein kinase PknK
MADADPQATQRDVLADIPAELCTAGFDDVVEIGHGGFGVVFRCVQPLLDREVAIKVLTADLDPTMSTDSFASSARWAGYPGIRTS